MKKEIACEKLGDLLFLGKLGGGGITKTIKNLFQQNATFSNVLSIVLMKQGIAYYHNKKE